MVNVCVRDFNRTYREPIFATTHVIEVNSRRRLCDRTSLKGCAFNLNTDTAVK